MFSLSQTGDHCSGFSACMQPPSWSIHAEFCPCAVACVVHVICIYSSSMYCLRCLCHLYIILIPLTHVLCVLYLTELCPCAVACDVSSLYRCHVQSFTDGRSLQWVFGLHVTALVTHTCWVLSLCSRLCRPCHFYILVIHVLPVLSLSFVHNSHPCNACSLCFVAMSHILYISYLSDRYPCAAACVVSSLYRCHVQSFTDGRSLQWVFGLHATALVIHTCWVPSLCCRLCRPCHLYILVIHVLPALFLSSVHNSHPCNACSLCFVSHWAMSHILYISYLSDLYPCAAACVVSSLHRCHVQPFTDGRSLQWVFGLHATALVIHTCWVLSLRCRLCCPCHLYIPVIHVLPALSLSSVHNSHPCNACSLCFVSHWAMSLCCRLCRLLPVSLLVMFSLSQTGNHCSGFSACMQPPSWFILAELCSFAVACVVHVICIYSSSMYCLCCLCHLYIIFIPVTHVLCVSYLTELCPCAVACVVSSLYRCHVQSFTDGRSLQWVFGLHATALVIHTCWVLSLCCRLCRPCQFYILVIHVLPVLSLSSVHNSHPCNACSLCFIAMSHILYISYLSDLNPCAAACVISSLYRCHVQSFTDGRSLQWVFGLHATALVIHTCWVLSQCCRLCRPCHLYILVIHVLPALSLSSVHNSHPCNACSLCFVSHWAMSNILYISYLSDLYPCAAACVVSSLYRCHVQSFTDGRSLQWVFGLHATTLVIHTCWVLSLCCRLCRPCHLYIPVIHVLPVLSLSSVHNSHPCNACSLCFVSHWAMSHILYISYLSDRYPCAAACVVSSLYRCHVQSFTDGRSLQWVFGLHATALVIHTCWVLSLCCRLCRPCHFYILVIHVLPALSLSSVHNSHPCNAYSLYFVSLWPISLCCRLCRLLPVSLPCSVFHRRAIIAVGFRPACNRPRDPYMLSSVPVLSPVSTMSFLYTRHPCIACVVFVICT